MAFHTHAASGLSHAIGHTASTAAAHSFIGGIAHSIVNAMIYSTVFRLMRHLPLWVDIAIIGVIVYFGYQYAKKRGQAPF